MTMLRPETTNGLCKKAGVIYRQFWKSREAVELAALAWVDCFNHSRLLELIGNIPPSEVEENYYQQLTESAQAAWHNNLPPRNPERFKLNTRSSV